MKKRNQKLENVLIRTFVKLDLRRLKEMVAVRLLLIWTCLKQLSHLN